MHGERLWAYLLLGGLTTSVGVSLFEQQANVSATQARADESRLVALEGRLEAALDESREITRKAEATGDIVALVQQRKALQAAFPTDAEMVELSHLRKRVRRIDQYMTLKP